MRHSQHRLLARTEHRDAGKTAGAELAIRCETGPAHRTEPVNGMGRYVTGRIVAFVSFVSAIPSVLTATSDRFCYGGSSCVRDSGPRIHRWSTAKTDERASVGFGSALVGRFRLKVRPLGVKFLSHGCPLRSGCRRTTSLGRPPVSVSVSLRTQPASSSTVRAVSTLSGVFNELQPLR